MSTGSRHFLQPCRSCAMVLLYYYYSKRKGRGKFGHAHVITSVFPVPVISGDVTSGCACARDHFRQRHHLKYDFFRADILLTMNTKLNTLYNEVSNKASICSAENIWIDFKTKLESLVKQHIPFKKLSTKIKTPWITHDTKKLIKKRDKLYKTMNKSGSKQQRDKYK